MFLVIGLSFCLIPTTLSQVNLSRGLVAYYPLNGNANDYSGNSLHGVMKNGGQAILMVPIVKDLDVIIEDPNESSVEVRWKKFGQDDHLRLYSTKGWSERVIQSGFKLQTLTAENIVNDPQLNGIDPNSVLYIAHKS